MKPIGLHRVQGDFSPKYRRASRTRERAAAAREVDPGEFEGIDETIAYEVQDAEEDPATVMPGKPRFGTYHGGGT
jgi:hypothetical protein